MKLQPYLYIDLHGKVRRAKQPLSDYGAQSRAVINVSYDQLVATFGKPNQRGKALDVDAAWEVHTLDGVAMIFNLKNGKHYLGADGPAVEDIREWHIAGHNYELVDHIQEALSKAGK